MSAVDELQRLRIGRRPIWGLADFVLRPGAVVALTFRCRQGLVCHERIDRGLAFGVGTLSLSNTPRRPDGLRPFAAFQGLADIEVE